jgi:hypothetical protein
MKGIPEGILSVFGIYIFTKSKIEAKLFAKMSIIFIVATYFIRFLPINYGVNTILSLLVLIVLAYKLLNVALIKSIKSTLYVAVLIILGESLSTILLIGIYGTSIVDTLKLLGQEKDASGVLRNLTNEQLFNEQLHKSILSIPSTIILAIFTIGAYFIFKNIAKKRKDNNGETHSEISQ